MKLPQGIIISVVVFFRYMPAVGHEFWYIVSSMKLRGVGITFKNIVSHPIRTAEYAFVPLIIRSITIADRLSESAMTRGLNLETNRSNYRQLRLHVRDWMTCAFICLLSIGSITM